MIGLKGWESYSYKWGSYSKASLRMANVLKLARYSTRMETSTMDSIKASLRMERGRSFTLMGIFMKVSGKVTGRTVKVGLKLI
jgi:hypothetical protein